MERKPTLPMRKEKCIWLISCRYCACRILQKDHSGCSERNELNMGKIGDRRFRMLLQKPRQRMTMDLSKAVVMEWKRHIKEVLRY